MEEPLVSIIVITYNSAEYVLETLESCKGQTYKNVELIISDDGSIDETVRICENWLLLSNERFARTKLITSKYNTGIPANCNRGVNASSGEWIKLIAGDDLLHKAYVQKVISEINVKSDAKNCLFCTNYFVINQYGAKINTSKLEETLYFKPGINVYTQTQVALRAAGTVPPVSAFYSREMFNKVGGFDEKYKLLEDYPFFLKANILGYQAALIKNVLCYYRKSETSVTAKGLNNQIFHSIFLYTYKVQFEFSRKYVPLIEKYHFAFQYYRALLFANMRMNKKSYKILYKGLNVFNVFLYYRKFFNRELICLYQNKLTV